MTNLCSVYPPSLSYVRNTCVPAYFAASNGSSSKFNFFLTCHSFEANPVTAISYDPFVAVELAVALTAFS